MFSKVLPASQKLVSINEKEERAAQKSFYDKVAEDMSQKKIKKLHFWQRVSIVYSPIFVMIFMIFYWIAGLKHADII